MGRFLIVTVMNPNPLDTFTNIVYSKANSYLILLINYEKHQWMLLIARIKMCINFFQDKTMQLDAFLTKLKHTPEQVSFADTIATVDTNYEFTPTAFRNGELENAAGQNSGSCKLLSLAKLHDLSSEQTLHCFG